MDRFEKKEMKKIRPNKNTWYDWLINNIYEPIRRSVGGFKVFLRQTQPTKLCMERTETKQTKKTKY